jgi:sulfoxide reductase heme-binding subunit YedZ
MRERRAKHQAPTSLSARAKDKWLTLVVHLGCLAPLVVLVWRYVNDDLGVDFINAIYTFTGRTAIILLALSLTASPISFIFGYSKALTVRRPLGLYAFFYALVHFSNFLGLDYALDLNFILQDALLNKPYIIAGLLALTLLIPLAITSTQGWQRRLRRNWTRLHRLVYLAALLAALHFFWQAKVPERLDPLIYGTVLLILLIVRIPPVRLWLVRTRQRLTARPAQTSRRVPAAFVKPHLEE